MHQTLLSFTPFVENFVMNPERQGYYKEIDTFYEFGIFRIIIGDFRKIIANEQVGRSDYINNIVKINNVEPDI